MSQASLALPTTGTLTGLQLVTAINSALAALSSQSSGATDPATMAGGVLPYSFWADSSVTPALLRMRNSANNGWIVIGDLTQSALGLASVAAVQQGGYVLAVAGGTANALTATLITTLTSLTNGQPFTLISAAANSSTAALVLTLGSTAIASMPIVKGANLPLVANDIPIAGYPCQFNYSQAFGAYVLQNPATGINATSTQIVGASRNLIGSAAGSTKTASWTADQVIALSALNGSSVTGTSLTLSFNGATTGLNGMDTGSVPTSADLYFYAAFKPGTGWGVFGTIQGTGSQIYSGANLPAGVTATALIHTQVTDSSGNLRKFSQQDRTVSPVQTGIFSSTTGVTSFTSQSVSVVVPKNAKTASYIGGLSSAANRNMALAADSSGTAQRRIAIASAGSFFGLTGGGSFKDVPIITSQTVFWASEIADASMYNLVVTDYTF